MEYLYHATYSPLLQQIQKWGLDTKRSKKNWEDSVPGHVYLAEDPDVAGSYAETSEVVPEAWLDDIIILAIDVSMLDLDKLFADQNVRNDFTDTYEYHGVIPWEAVSDVQKYN